MKLKRQTKLSKLVDDLNDLERYKYHPVSALLKHKRTKEVRVLSAYLVLLRNKGFIDKDGRGREAFVSRQKRVPYVKVKHSAVIAE